MKQCTIFFPLSIVRRKVKKRVSNNNNKCVEEEEGIGEEGVKL